MSTKDSSRTMFVVQKVVANTATAFCADGYVIQSKFESLAYTFYKLWHRRNGSEILISAWPSRNRWTITRNGKIAKNGKIYEEKAVPVY